MVHHPTHWIAIALVVALALLAFEASGQPARPDKPSTDASAMFEGRPVLAGAQAGLGAQAGPPQGGIGVQGSEAAELNLRAPRVIREAREEKDRLAAQQEPVLAQNDVDLMLLPPRTIRRAQ